MKRIVDMSFEEIKSRFLAGEYVFNTDEHSNANSTLHDKLEDIASLVPMLQSGNKGSQTDPFNSPHSLFASRKGNDCYN